MSCSYMFLCWGYHVGRSNWEKNVEKSMSYTYCDNTTPRQQARGEFVDTCRYAYILWVSTRQKRNSQRHSWCSLSVLMVWSWNFPDSDGAEIFRFGLFKLLIQSMRFQESLRWILDDTFPTSQDIKNLNATSRGNHLIRAPNNTFEHVDWAVFLQVNWFQWRPGAENHIQDRILAVIICAHLALYPRLYRNETT